MKLHRTILATTVAAFTTITADAALVTWSAPSGISGDSDVSTAGTFLEAYNLGGPGVLNTTVNGVTFTALPMGGNNVSAGNVTLTTPGGFSPLGAGSGSAPFASLSAPYQALLGQGAFSFAEPVSLTLGGLTVGATYQFQWWTNFSGAGGTVFTTATAGNSVTLADNLSTVNGGLGQYAIGTFVADSTTQLIAFSTPDSSASTINAFQLRQTALAPAAVPEPGTALAGVMLAGLLGLRRRRATVPAHG